MMYVVQQNGLNVLIVAGVLLLLAPVGYKVGRELYKLYSEQWKE